MVARVAARQAVRVMVGAVAVEAKAAELVVVAGVPASWAASSLVRPKGLAGVVRRRILPAQRGYIEAYKVGLPQQRLGLAHIGPYGAQAQGFEMQFFQRRQHLRRQPGIAGGRAGQS